MVAGEATLLLDGVDIEALTECVEGPITWPYQGFTQRGELPRFPGVDGALSVSQPYNDDVLPVQFTLRTPACSGVSGDAIRDALRDVRTSCRPDRSVTLRRLWDDGSYEDALAKFLNITPTRPLKNVMSCLLEFTLLELWYGPAVTGVSAAGSQNILGDTRTHRMTFTLASGGPTRTITNETNGYWFTFADNVPSSGVLIDVEARTAVDLSTSPPQDISESLSWGKKYPMRFEPGVNVLTVSAGSASYVYQPAYL